MIKNRSVPVDTLLPHVCYANVAAAIQWLQTAFGFVEHYRYGNDPDGAQMHLGDAWIMVNQEFPGRQSPLKAGAGTQFVTIYVQNVGEHYARSRKAGAQIVEDLQDTIYGERLYTAQDPEGHRWQFSQHVRDVSPEEFGATMAESA